MLTERFHASLVLNAEAHSVEGIIRLFAVDRDLGFVVADDLGDLQASTLDA